MTPFLVVWYLCLGGMTSQAVRQATQWRHQQLEAAVLRLDPALLEGALRDGADVNRPVHLTSARLHAAGCGDRCPWRYFAEEPQATPLMIAAALGQTELCAQLLRHGAHRFQTSSWGWIAAQGGHPELARALFSADPAAVRYRIDIGLARQTIVLYKDGRPVIWAKVSTGRPGFATPPGHYLVTDKERLRRSSLYKVPMPYFLRLSF